MLIRQSELVVLVGLLLALAGGCKKSEPAEPTVPRSQAVPSTPSDVIARVHWLGKDRLSTETNAAAFMRIWQTPESVRLQSETIQKLSRAPWRSGDAGATNADSALLQPLLEDVVRAESYLEIRQSTNQSIELAFAINVNEERARLWETNLGRAVESLSGNKTVARPSGGWQIECKVAGDSRPWSCTLGRAGDWTIFGASRYGNSLTTEFGARILRDRAPFTRSQTNYWIEAEAELPKLAILLHRPSNITEGITRISATVTGDGENVRSRADVYTSRLLPPSPDSWAIPTNLIPSSLISLTAARDMSPLLKRLKLFEDLKPEDTPDQLYVWDLNGPPLKMFYALRVKDAAGSMDAIAPQLTNAITISTPRFGTLAFDTNASRLAWTGLPFASPFVQALTNFGQQYLFGGFGVYSVVRTNPISPDLLAHIVDGTNLVYFDWEHTGEKIVHWRYFDDASRIIFDNAHLARFRGDSASLGWIGAISTNLAHSVTEVKAAGKDRLSFARKSTVGLTAVEIEFLANWLDLQQFPSGLETILKTNSTPRPPRQRTTPSAPGAPK